MSSALPASPRLLPLRSALIFLQKLRELVVLSPLRACFEKKSCRCAAAPLCLLRPPCLLGGVGSATQAGPLPALSVRVYVVCVEVCGPERERSGRGSGARSWRAALGVPPAAAVCSIHRILSLQEGFAGG
jgi:hypothetical protein